MNRDTCIPYINLEIGLHGCVPYNCIDKLREEIKDWLVKRLDCDYESDVEVDLMESAGMI